MENRKYWYGVWVVITMGSVAACGSSASISDTGAYYSSSGAGANYPGSGGGNGVPDPINPNPVPPPPAEETTCGGLNQDEPVVLYLSADDSNSMGSPAVTRERLAAGYGHILGAIRTHEFLNYYNIDYPAAEPGNVAIYPQLAVGGEADTFDLQIGVRAFDLDEDRPKTITFSLDTSGSMGGIPMHRERTVVLAIAKRLRQGDIVNMVTWSSSQDVLLEGHVASGPNDPTVVSIAESLEAGGGTDLEGGLERAYELATEHYGESRLNRVVLISDGGANLGVTSAELIAKHSADADKEGIYLVGVGAAEADFYDDALMDTITDQGRGAYVFIDSNEEADKMFNQRFNEVMDVAARGVQVELTLPWYFEMKKFYGEEYSEDPEQVEPQHLAPNDAMVFNQVIAPCDGALVADSDEVQITVTWQEPLTYEERAATSVTTFGELLAGDTTQLQKGKAIVAYAEALKTGTSDALLDAHQTIDTMDNPDADLMEIKQLITHHPAFPAL